MDDDLTPEERLAEMATQMQALLTENETLLKLLTSDTQLADAIAKIRGLEAEVAVLRERNDGLMAEKAAAIQSARRANNKLNKVVA